MAENHHTSNKPRIRLDQLLVQRGFYGSRARAQDAISRGTVKIDYMIAKKSGQLVLSDAAIEIDDPAEHYVSRAALKLKAGLEHYAFDVSGKTALDIGASTGGFCQVLLEQGARHVIGVDVGHGQMHDKIACDPRITNIENVNARDLEPSHLGGHDIDFVVSDVSFISLKLALPRALGFATQGAKCILLIKPQFEVGRDGIGKGGLLKDPSQGSLIAQDLQNWLNQQDGWSALDVIPSPITGGDGNQEYLLGGVKS